MSDINMTPLIDVMLVLLVIFMITAPLMTASLKLDLPQDRRRHAERRSRVHRGRRSTATASCSSATKRSTREQLDTRVDTCRRGDEPATPRCSCAPTGACPTAASPS